MRALLICGLSGALVFAAWGTAQAQFTTGSTSRSTMFGSSSMGGLPTAGNRTAFGSSSSGRSSSSFGSSSLGGSSFGSSSLGGSSLGSGGSSFGSGGRGGSSLGGSSLGSGGAGQLNASDRFVRGNRQPGQFVGSDTQDVQNMLRSMGATGGVQGLNNRAMGNMTGGRNTGRGNQANRANQPGANQPGGGRGSAADLAVTISTGFQAPSPPAATVVAGLSERLTKMKGIQRLSPIQALMSDGTVVLQGEVASPHDRALAEQLAMLEPGVRSVRNELLVRPSGPTPPAPASIPEAPPRP